MKFKRGKVTLSIILISVFFFLFFLTPVSANELTIQKKNLGFEVIATLSSQETNNEFMGLSHENRFVFAASCQEIVVIENKDLLLVSGKDTKIIGDEEIPISKVKIPKTGSIQTEFFFLAGVAIVAVGIVLKKKGK